MTDTRLPDALRAATETLALEPGKSLAGRAAELSAAYRQMTPSSSAVTDRADIVAYLLTRMPATYAAVVSVLGEVVGRVADFAPKSLLDAGAGPGTASWAVAESFHSVEAVSLLDRNRGLLEMAGELAAASPNEALARAERIGGSLVAPPVGQRRFDLVVAAYALAEISDTQLPSAATELWERCAGVFVIIEPGRPRDYQRLLEVRKALSSAGAEVVAPCPHDAACPLPEGDWCHFSARLQRSRAHMRAKGGTIGYEDEKFSYLVVARPHLRISPASARVIRQRTVKKFEIELPLCGPDGLETRKVAKRDAAAFKAARKLDWGDAIG
ncbi:MAG TPA: small ribosomal subunit Rsm22 family protein [Devosiaceae bacterium]|nr:small ribosomal subunit Rsm22 family protein [Devosiaceae bacterium]